MKSNNDSNASFGIVHLMIIAAAFLPTYCFGRPMLFVLEDYNQNVNDIPSIDHQDDSAPVLLDLLNYDEFLPARQLQFDDEPQSEMLDLMEEVESLPQQRNLESGFEPTFSELGELEKSYPLTDQLGENAKDDFMELNKRDLELLANLNQVPASIAKQHSRSDRKKVLTEATTSSSTPATTTTTAPSPTTTTTKFPKSKRGQFEQPFYLTNHNDQARFGGR